MKTNLFVKSVSVLLSVIMIASIFTVLPTSVFAAEKDTAAVSAEADIAEVSVLEFEEPEERIFVANSGETITGISAGLMGWNYTNTYFQWYRVTDEGDVAVEGATSDMFDAPIPDTPGDTYTYYCIVRRGSETARSYDHLVTRTTEWDSRYMSGPIEDIVLESSVRDQFGMYPNMTCDNFFTEVYRTNGSNYDDPVMVNCDYTSGYLTINDDEWQEGESRYYYIYFKPTSSLYFRSNVFKVTKPAGYDPTPNLNITVGTIFSPVPTKEVPSWRDSESEGIFQYKGARTYAYFFTPFDDKEHSLTDLAVTFYRCDNEDGTGNNSVLGRAHADDLSAYPGVNDDAAFENDLKCLLPSDTAGEYYVYAEYTAAANGVSFNKTTGVTRVTVEDVSYDDYFRFDASTGTITGYYGCEDTIVYPAEIKGVKVKKIRTTELTDSTVNSAQQPFQDVYRTCRKAILPEGLEQIPEYTFLGEKFLEEANVPNSVTRINRYSFYRCARLKSVTVGDSDDNGSSRLSYIEGGAFCFSDVLEKLDFGNCGTNISSNVTKNRAPFGFLPALTEFIAPANAQMNLNFNTANYPFNRSSELKQITNIANINRSGIPNRNYITVPHIFFMLRDKQETAEYDESFIYYPDEENEGWTIGGYLRKVAETDGDLIFPDTFMGKKITRIGVGDNIEYSLFEFGNYPLRLVIGQYVKEIGAHAFEDAFTRGVDFSKKVEIVLPASLTTVGAYAFCHSSQDETRLGKVNLSDTSVSFIGESAFKNQYFADFGELVFHSDVTVEDQAFMISDPLRKEDFGYINHDTLLSLTVEGSAEIGYQAFYRHSTLKSVSVSGTLTLDQDAFDKCYYIENVSFGGSDGTFGVDAKGEIIDGKIVDDSRGFSHFRYTPAFPEVTDTQKVEGYTELNDAHKQTWERTYKRSDNIGYYVDRCEIDSEETVQGTIAYTFEPSVRLVLPGRIEDDAIQIVDFTTLLDFYDQTQEYSLNIGEGINLLLNTTEYWHPYDDSAPHHGARNHYYLTNCSSIHFPSTVKRIPSHFLFNAKLKGTVEIPGTVEQIDRNAFAVNEIDTLILHEGTKVIGPGAFSTGICSLDYGYGSASDFTSSLDYAYNTFDKETPNVKHIVTAEKRELKEADTLPDSVETIDRYAFADCGLNSRLILPSGVEQLGGGAFTGTAISEIMSQGGVINSFGSGAFENCTQLKKVDFSNTTVEALGEKCFATDYSELEYAENYTTRLHSSIEELYLPKGLVTVGADALLLVNPSVIHLPDSVTEYNVKYPPVVNDNDTPYTVNGKTLPELSITIPENTTIISRSLFNLGTITFLNRDQEVKTKRDSYGSVLTEDLPDSIPDYCTVRCYKNSFIYNWCVDKKINYELIGGENTLAVRILDPDSSDLSSSDLQSIIWRDRTDGIIVDGGRLYCDPLDFDSTHVYECEITFTQEDYNTCKIPRTMRFTFDPASADFSTQQVLRLDRRSTVTVVGSFGEQAKLDGFSLTFVAQSVYGDTVYPAEIAADGSFTAEVPRMSVYLSASVPQEVHFMPLKLMNIAYRDLNDEGKIDLGSLSLAKEPIVPSFILHTDETLTTAAQVRLYSADGERSVYLDQIFGYVFAPNLSDVFEVGEEVRMEVLTPDSCPTDYYSGIFTLAGTKSAIKQEVGLTAANKGRFIINSRDVNVDVIIYDSKGIKTAAYISSSDEDVTKYIGRGSYTLVAVQSGKIGTGAETLQMFHDNLDNYQIAGYVEKEFEVNDAEDYIFNDDVPLFIPFRYINLDCSFDPSLMSDNGSIPMYITYRLSEEYKENEGDRVIFTLGPGNSGSSASFSDLPLVKAGGRYATIKGGSGEIEETVETTLGKPGLTINAPANGTVCLYVIPNGSQMSLSVYRSFYSLVELPMLSFEVVPPQEYTDSPTGSIIFNSPANQNSTIRLYVDGELSSETPMPANNNIRHTYNLPYTLKTYPDGASAHTIYVEVVEEDEVIWTSDIYNVIHADTKVPVPTKMDIRIAQKNSGADKVTALQYASLDLLTGKYVPMRYSLPPYYYNEDGTMAMDITIDYYLTVDRPELVDGDIFLSVYCCKTSPFLKEAKMYYNSETDTFDGQLTFEEGTYTINDLPYGFDLDIPANVSVSYSESSQVKKFEKAWSEKLNNVGLDEKFKEIYERKPDVDELSYLLDNATEFADFTAEEKQKIIDAAVAQNELNATYEELCSAEDELLTGFNIDAEKILNATDVSDYMNIIASASKLQAVTAVPETLDKTALTGKGYAYHNTSYGVFYTRSDDTGFSLIDAAHNTEYRFSTAAETKSALNTSKKASKELAETGFIPVGEDAVSASLRRAAEVEDDLLRSDVATWAECCLDFATAFVPALTDAGVKLAKIESDLMKAIQACTLDPKLIAKLGLTAAKIKYDIITFNGKTYYVLSQEGASFLETLANQKYVEGLLEALENTRSAQQYMARLAAELANAKTMFAGGVKGFAGWLAKVAVKFGGKLLSGAKLLVKAIPYAGGVLSAVASLFDIYISYSDLTEIYANNAFTKTEMFDPTVKLYNRLLTECEIENKEYYMSRAKELMDDFYKAHHKVSKNTCITLAWQLGAEVTNFGTSVASCVPIIANNQAVADVLMTFGLALTASQIIEIGIYALATKDAVEKVKTDTREFQKLVAEMKKHAKCGGGGGSNPTPYNPEDPEEPEDDKPKPPEGSNNPPSGEPPYPTDPRISLDPSGYVYEAVASNRVEGATAKIYYKGDGGEPVYWDEAAEYHEINPQTTDQFGEYGWMTPIGKWKVVITKDGYEDADSSSDPAADEDGWLPVPPPQLNVDIPLVSKAAPETEYAAASDKSIAIVFSQYMDIAQLESDPSLITVTENGESVPVSFTFTDREESPTQEGVYYGRILHIARTDGLRFLDSITLSVSKDFRNYAGTGFTGAYEQELSVGQIPTEISHSYPNRLVMELSDDFEVCVRITDEDGAPVAGETVAIKALYSDLLTIESTTAVTDEDGVARFHVKGIRSGDELLTFTLDNGVKATMKLCVKAPGDIAPEKPAANLTDFAVVESGTELVLTCDTEGAVIYYTTDDTCPCQDTESRKEYTGPIKLIESGFYRIAAYTDEGGYSERINLHINVRNTVKSLLGDVDGDSEVEIRDATWIQRSVADIEIPFTIKKLTADADGDGKITVMDATLIQYYLANMKNPYNIGKTVS